MNIHNYFVYDGFVPLNSFSFPWIFSLQIFWGVLFVLTLHCLLMWTMFYQNVTDIIIFLWNSIFNCTTLLFTICYMSYSFSLSKYLSISPLLYNSIFRCFQKYYMAEKKLMSSSVHSVLAVQSWGPVFALPVLQKKPCVVVSVCNLSHWKEQTRRSLGSLTSQPNLTSEFQAIDCSKEKATPKIDHWIPHKCINMYTYVHIHITDTSTQRNMHTKRAYYVATTVYRYGLNHDHVIS